MSAINTKGAVIIGVSTVYRTSLCSDASNAFWFESTSSGVKKDALISNGGRSFGNDIDFHFITDHMKEAK